MKRMSKAFFKKLFGAKYERAAQAIFICLTVFFGLHIAGLKVRIAPSVLYLMTMTFTAGVMWQALSSDDNAVYMQNMMMLPFGRTEFVFSYVTALGSYTLLTKTAALLAVLLAVSDWSRAGLLGSIFCAVNAILMAAAIFSLRRHRYAGILWSLAVLAVILFGWDRQWFVPVTAANDIFAVLLLYGADGYCFYDKERKSARAVKGHSRYSVWRYLLRYLKSHRNYWMNTAIMWCVACVLPLFFEQMESRFALPIGFAILSLNTPICILLSCDPASEQMVHFLPNQRKRFFVPYIFFIFLCNMAADAIFLCSMQIRSLQIQTGGVTIFWLFTAVFFALQSAVFSVFLEEKFPIRSWKTESDLWHHPRKYLVPVSMLLLAGVVTTMPEIVPVLLVLLAAEIEILLQEGFQRVNICGIINSMKRG